MEMGGAISTFGTRRAGGRRRPRLKRGCIGAERLITYTGSRRRRDPRCCRGAPNRQAHGAALKRSRIGLWPPRSLVPMVLPASQTKSCPDLPEMYNRRYACAPTSLERPWFWALLQCFSGHGCARSIGTWWREARPGDCPPRGALPR